MATSIHHSTDGDGPTEFSFIFKKPQFSQIESSIFSVPVTVQNIQWRIVIKKIENEVIVGLGKYLGFYVSCKANCQWSCPVRATLTVLSQKKGTSNFFRIVEDIFSSEENEFGVPNFMEWFDVIDPQRGYIVDDTVKFEAYIIMDIPNIGDDLYQNVLENDYRTDNEDPLKLNELALVANQWDEDLFRRVSREVNSSKKELQTFVEEAIKRLRGDLRISIESAVQQFRTEINSLRIDERVHLNCCSKFRKEDLEESDFQSELHKIIDRKIDDKLLESRSLFSEARSCASLHNSVSRQSYCDNYSHRDHDYCRSRLLTGLKSWCSSNLEEEYRMNFDGNLYAEKLKQEDAKVSLNGSLGKELTVIVTDENGQLKTVRPTSSEELSTLIKKFPDCKILE